NRREHGVAVLQAVFAAIVRLRNDKLSVTEHVVCLGHFLQTQTVDSLNVRYMSNLVRLHDIQTNTGYPGVSFVVDEQVLAIITTVCHGNVRVVAITVQELLVATQNLLTFVGDTPASSGVYVEHRNTHQLTHGRHAQNAHLTLVSTAPEAVVLIQLTGLDVNLVLGFLGGSRESFARHDGRAQARCTGNTGQSSCTHKETTAKAAFRGLRRIVARFISFFHRVPLRYWLRRFSFSFRPERRRGSDTFQCTRTTGISSGCPGALCPRRLPRRFTNSGGHSWSWKQVIW